MFGNIVKDGPHLAPRHSYLFPVASPTPSGTARKSARTLRRLCASPNGHSCQLSDNAAPNLNPRGTAPHPPPSCFIAGICTSAATTRNKQQRKHRNTFATHRHAIHKTRDKLCDSSWKRDAVAFFAPAAFRKRDKSCGQKNLDNKTPSACAHSPSACPRPHSASRE